MKAGSNTPPPHNLPFMIQCILAHSCLALKCSGCSSSVCRVEVWRCWPKKCCKSGLRVAGEVTGALPRCPWAKHRPLVQDVSLIQWLHVHVFFVCTNVCVPKRVLKTVITPSLGTNSVRFVTVLHDGSIERVQAGAKVWHQSPCFDKLHFSSPLGKDQASINRTQMLQPLLPVRVLSC